MNQEYSPEVRERVLGETKQVHANPMSAVVPVARLLGLGPEMSRAGVIERLTPANASA